ncbi:ribosomal protein L23 [Fagus crenata]
MQVCGERSRNRRALILGWAYYLDAFSSYSLHTWLPSVYCEDSNWYTKGASFLVLSY